MTSEKVGANQGTVNYFAKNDFKIFKKLFDFDFSKIEEALDIDCFSTVNHYKAIGRKKSECTIRMSAKKCRKSAARLRTRRMKKTFLRL